MYATRTADAFGRRFRGARGLTAGLVAAAGALLAHALAGGSVSLVPGLAVLAVSLPLATLLTRIGTVDLSRLALTALVAQAVGHLALMMAPQGAHQHGHLHGAAVGGADAHILGLSGPMLLTHVAVAVATTAVAAGLDRALVAAVWSILGWLLLPWSRRVQVPVRARLWRQRSRIAVASQTASSTVVPRGPPLVVHDLQPFPRIAH